MQMNLLVGSYFKYEYGAAEALKQAFALINWWRWHLVPFEWLLMEMDHPMALLTGCLTRWGSQVAAIIRLLQFKQAMQVVLVRRKQEILDTIAKKDRVRRQQQFFQWLRQTSSGVPWHTWYRTCCQSGLLSGSWSQTQPDWTQCWNSMAEWQITSATAHR